MNRTDFISALDPLRPYVGLLRWLLIALLAALLVALGFRWGADQWRGEYTAEVAARAADNAAHAATLQRLAEAQSANSTAVQQLRTDVDEQGQEFAAAITQVKSSIGGSGNILNNAGFGGMRGWTVTVNQYGAAATAEPNSGNIGDGGGPYLPPQTMGVLTRAVGTFPAGTVMRVASDRIAIAEVDRLIGSVYVNSFRCIVRAFVYYFDKGNNYLGEAPTIELNQPSLTAPTLSQMPRLSAVMPSGVASVATARIAFEMVATGTQSNPYAWFAMPMLEKVAADKETPSPWVDGAGGLASATFAMKTAQDAQITIATDVNGRWIGSRTENDGVRGGTTFIMDYFRLLAADGASASIEITGNYLRVFNANYQKIIGVGFGVGGALMEWFGPNIGAANCTTANCIECKTTAGVAIIRGSNAQGSMEIMNTLVTIRDNNNVKRVEFGLLVD